MNKTSTGSAVGVVLAGLTFATWLLKQSLVSQNIFLSLIALSTGASLLVAFAPVIKKVGIWKLTFELREVTNAAEEILEQLKRSVEYAFVPALASITEFSGGFGDLNSTEDERLPKFLKLAAAIEGAGCSAHHAADLAAAARVIAIGQLHKFAYFSTGAVVPSLDEPLPTVDALKAEAFLPDRIEYHCQIAKKTKECLISQLHAVIDSYSKIYPYTL